MTDIAQFVERIDSRRNRRRSPMEPAAGMRGLVSGLDSAAMMDSAQGADIMDAAPNTRLRSSGPLPQGSPEGQEVEILPGGRLQYSGQDAPQGDTPVQEVGRFNRRGGSSRPAYSPPRQQMVCEGGVCRVVGGSTPFVSNGQVISSGMPVGSSQVISSSPMAVESAAPLRIGDIVQSTLQMQEYDIDPSAKRQMMPMYTPQSMFQAGLQVFNAADERLGRGDSGAAIAAVQGFKMAQTLLTESATMFQNRQTFAIMEARMAAADRVVHLGTPLGKAEEDLRLLSDARFTPKERASRYTATLSQAMKIEGLSPQAQAEQLEAMKGAYKTSYGRAVGFDVSRMYLANKMDRPNGGPITDLARREQAEISRQKSLTTLDEYLTENNVPLEDIVPEVRNVAGRPLEQSLLAFYEMQRLPDAAVRAQAEADQYALATAQALIERRGGTMEEAYPPPLTTSSGEVQFDNRRPLPNEGE